MKLPDINHAFWSAESDLMNFLGLENARAGYEKMKKKNPSLPDIKFDKYYIREKQAPVGFKLNKDKRIEFDLSKPTKKEKFKGSNIIGPDKEKSKIEYEYYFDKEFENEPIKNLLKIEKVGEKLTSTKTEEVTLQGKKYTIKKPVLTKEKLFGASFEIEKKDFKKQLDITETNNTIELENGEYIVKEIKAPEGFVLGEEKLNILVQKDEFIKLAKLNEEIDALLKEMEKDYLKKLFLAKELEKKVKEKDELVEIISKFTTDNIVEKTVENNRKKLEITVKKSFEGSSTSSNNWAIFGLFSDEKTTHYNKDDLIEVIEINNNSSKKFNHDLLGKYYVKELDSSSGYFLEKKEFKIDSQKDLKHEIAVDNKLIPPSEPPTFTFELTKKDTMSLKNVAGAKVEIKDKDGNVVYTGVTDEKGLIKTKLKLGEYTYHEIIAPEGFVRADKYGELKVDEKGATIEKVLWNEPITSDFELTKKDTMSLKNVAGAVVEFYDKDGKVVAKETTDKDGKIRLKLRYGKYTYKEVIAPKGYVRAEKYGEISVTKHGAKIEQVLWNEPIPQKPTKLPKTNIKSAKIFSILLFVSGISGAVIIVLKRKKEENK